MKILENTLTVDPGLSGKGTTGWAYWNGSKPSTGLIEVSRKLDWSEKCHKISQSLGSVVTVYNIKNIYIEFPRLFISHVGFASIAKNDLFKLVYLVGCIGMLSHDRGCKVNFLEPHQWKGQMNKEVVNKRIKRKLNRIYENHISDAVGMGLYLIHGKDF